MKKLTLIILLILGTVMLYAQTPSVQNNVLWNEPFIIRTVTETGVVCGYNPHWQGFKDNTSAGFGFFRKVTDTGTADPLTENYFLREYNDRKGSAEVYVSTLPGDPKKINAPMFLPGYDYEVGFSMLADSVYFDQKLTQYGFTVKLQWYDSASKLIGTVCENANLDSGIIGKTGAPSADTQNQWVRYRNRVTAPFNAAYFKFSIYADSGVYTDSGSKVYIEDPVMIKKDPKFASAGLETLTASTPGIYNIYNNTLIKNGYGDDAYFKILISRNYIANLAINWENVKVLKWIYPATSPGLRKTEAVSFVEKNLTDFQPYYKYKINYTDLPNGKYVFETEFVYENSVLAREKTDFYVGDESWYLGGKYARNGVKEIKINGEPTFLMGLVDRGVNFGSEELDDHGSPKGLNTVPGTAYGADIVGSNSDFVKISPATGYPEYADLTDYLNVLKTDQKGFFDYETFRSFGLNAVYPAYLARLPIISKNNNFGTAFRDLTLAVSNMYVVLPMTEFSKKNLTREMQYKMNMEKDLFGYKPEGAGNAFSAMTEAFAGLTNSVAYMTGENISFSDTKELKDRKEQLYRKNSAKPVAVSVDLDNIEYDSYTGRFAYPQDFDKIGNILFLNFKPAGRYWEEGEIDRKLAKLAKYLHGYGPEETSLNYSVFVNVSLAKKYDKDEIVPLEIGDLVKIYRTVKQSSNAGGLFFDSLSNMTLVPNDGTGEPVFHYNLFKLFLEEKDSDDYNPATDIVNEPLFDYISQNIKISGTELKDAVREIHFKTIGENEYETAFCFNNVNDSNVNLNIAPSPYFIANYNPRIEYAETDRTSMNQGSVQLSNEVQSLNLNVGPREIYNIKIKLNYVPIEPTVSIVSEKDSVKKGGNVQFGYAVEGEPVSDIQWSSLDETVAAVDDNGLVTGIAAGNTKIKLSYKWSGNTYSATKDINVYGDFKITVSPKEVSDKTVNDTIDFSYTCDTDHYTVTDIAWVSDNESAVTVDSTGKATCIGEGTAKIYVTCKADGTDYTSEKVAVNVLPDTVTVTITPDEEINIAGGPDNTSVKLEYKVSGGKEITDVEWSTNYYALKVDQTGLVTAKEGCADVYNVTLTYKYKGEEYSVTKDIGAFVVAVRMPSFTDYFKTKQTLQVDYNSSIGPMIRNGGVHILTPDTIVQSGSTGPYSIFVDIVGEGKEAAEFLFDLTNANGEFPGRHIDLKGLKSSGEAYIEFTPTISPESLTAKMGVKTPIDINITRGGLECEIKSVTPEDPSVAEVYGTTMFKGIKAGDTNFVITYHPKNVDKEFTVKVPVHITE